MSISKYRRYIVKFYNKTAIIRDQNNFEKISALMEGTDQYHFEFSLNSSLLNTWPNSTLLLAGYWTPALKNNPLYNNNPQVAEAVDVNDTDDAVLINDNNRSEESYTSSLSSSFVDSEFLRKTPAINVMDEETGWNLIMRQPSTSYTTSSTSGVTKDSNAVEVLKEDSTRSETTEAESNIVEKKEENSTPESLNSEQQNENVPNNEAAKVEVIQSYNDLLESYNLRMKSLSDTPKVEDLYKQLTVKRIIEEQHCNEPDASDVSKFYTYI